MRGGRDVAGAEQSIIPMAIALNISVRLDDARHPVLQPEATHDAMSFAPVRRKSREARARLISATHDERAAGR